MSDRELQISSWDRISHRKSSEVPKTEPHHGLKEKVIHVLIEFLTIFSFLAPLFLAFATYRRLLLKEFPGGFFEYGAAIVNALVLSKIILMGESLRLGKRYEHWPLIYLTAYKAFLFTLLVAVFHLLENAVKGFTHGEGISATFAELYRTGIGEHLARSAILFFAFLPFFALRETGRVLGEHKLADLFLRSRDKSDQPARR